MPRRSLGRWRAETTWQKHYVPKEVRMKSICFRFLATALLSSCSFSVVSAKAEPRVGMLLPLSGNYAALGVDNKQGIEAALELSPYKAPLKIE
jgi:ABC-type branched-subunit amino acid transport system substrate-binding protein